MKEELKEHLRKKLNEIILLEAEVGDVNVDDDPNAPFSPVPPYFKPDIYFPAYNPFPYGFPGMGNTPHGWNYDLLIQWYLDHYGYWPFDWDPSYNIPSATPNPYQPTPFR